MNDQNPNASLRRARLAAYAAAISAFLLESSSSGAGVHQAANQAQGLNQASNQVAQSAGHTSNSNGGGMVATSYSSTEAAIELSQDLLEVDPLALTINRGLAGLSEEVIPGLAEPDYFSFPNALFWDEEPVSCLRIDAGIKNSSLSAPVTPQSVTGYFGNNGKVFANVDLDSLIRTTFFWDVEVAPGFSACDLLGALDNVADWFVNLFGGTSGGSQTADDISFEQLTLSAEGLTADVDITLGLSGNSLRVTSVDQLNVEFGAINFSGTPLLQLLTELAATGVSLLYGDVTDFINDEINTNLIPEQESRLQDIVNVALEQNLAVDQTIALGTYNASVEVAPSALKSSRADNTLTMEFNFAIDSAAPTAGCAGALGFVSSPRGAAERSQADFDLQIPHWILAKVIYEAGRQGLFCQSTLMPGSSEPWTIKPNGSLRVENGRYTVTETSPSGFPMSMEYHRGDLLLTVPMLFTGDGAGYFGTATADLQVYFTLDIPEGDRSVYLVVSEINMGNVAGAMTFSKGRVVDMSSVLDTFLNAAADRLTDSLGAIPILPQVTAFADDLGLEIHQILINDSHTTVGVNIVPVITHTLEGTAIDPATNQGHIRFPDEDDLPEFDTGPIDRLDPVP
ncbi:MAG: hypothetical protein U1G07_18985 [Verrucomicrobiota bacterium]